MEQKSVHIIKLSEANNIAKTISNKTAQLIIEFISSNQKATASTIAKKLDLPASTVHYNLKALLKAGIIDDSEFTYSTKGKTIIHYTLTNNIIVIIPESQDKFSLLNSLKTLVPSIVGVIIVGIGYALLNKQSANPLPESAAFARSFPHTDPQPIISDFFWGLLLASLIFSLVYLLVMYLHKNRK